MNLRATDFRIGNLLYCKEISQFAIPIASIETAINYSNYKDEYIIHFNWEGEDEQTGATIDKCEPVPLTEEWLIKFGFQQNISNRIFHSYYKMINDFDDQYKAICVTPDAGNQYVLLREGDLDKDREEDNLVGIFNGDIRKHPIYVHTLQNLYFALTGTELTIN